MECEGVKVQVSTLLDASLDVEQVKAMEQHLESCPSCARFYQEELEVAHWLTDAGDFNWIHRRKFGRGLTPRSVQNPADSASFFSHVSIFAMPRPVWSFLLSSL